MALPTLTVPAPIHNSHDLSMFHSGEHSLDEWLKKRALKNEKSTTSRTYVTCTNNRVAGYYCLSAGAVSLQIAPKKLTRNTPDPIPIMVIGRLAVDKAYQNMGIGKALLRDAVDRSLKAREIAGVPALLVHALSQEATRFYLSCGFLESPVQPITLCLSLAQVDAILENAQPNPTP